MLVTLDVFHFDISGNDINESHLKNIPCILVTLEVSHFDMSGNEINKLHSLNMNSILVTLDVSHFDISGKDFKEIHPSNIQLIFFIFIKLDEDNNVFSMILLKSKSKDSPNFKSLLLFIDEILSLYDEFNP